MTVAHFTSCVILSPQCYTSEICTMSCGHSITGALLPFSILDLHPGQNEATTLQVLIDRRFAQVSAKDKVHCSHCNQKFSAHMQTIIKDPPEFILFNILQYTHKARASFSTMVSRVWTFLFLRFNFILARMCCMVNDWHLLCTNEFSSMLTSFLETLTLHWMYMALPIKSQPRSAF